jgi:hypothetical protein
VSYIALVELGSLLGNAKIKIKETQISGLIKHNGSRLREAMQNATQPKSLAPT